MTDHIDRIREAARLMRRRAEAATRVAPAPWRQIVTDSESLDGIGICDDHKSDPNWPCDICWTIETWSEVFAEHAVSWHPAVALVVADWLDLVVQSWVDPKTVKHYQTRQRNQEKALAVARAYLGEVGRG